MKPSIGQIVHYRRNTRDTYPTAAIVLDVLSADDSKLKLKVFMPHPDHDEVVTTLGMAENYAEAKAGEWCWPERV